MNRAVRRFATIATLILMLIPVLEAAEKAKMITNTLPPRSDSMSIWQARRAVVANLLLAAFFVRDVAPSNFRFTFDSLEFDGKKGRNREYFKVDLKSLPPVLAKPISGGRYKVTDEAGKDLPAPLRWWVLTYLDVDGKVDRAAVAESLAAELNRLRKFANDTDAPLRFSRQAAAWRAPPSKPPIPEEIRQRRLLAESAIQEKKPAEALIHYETGVEIYPTWPQGYFNAALIAAELGYFAEAIEHMQAYLELVPDAPDAQSARDQIVMWQYKAKQPVTEPRTK